ncbi:MAG: xanthine dehydrogenase accessory protein XdhC [Hyphomicrobiales bacterium]
MYKQRHDIRAFLDACDAVAYVEIDEAQGSTPRETGAWMLVGETSIFRTIGGGQLENMAIEKARQLLSKPIGEPVEMSVPLGPDIGQCCGGKVDLSIKCLDPTEMEKCATALELEADDLPSVYIFGAGHVGNALAEALLLLPVNPVLIDTRADMLALAPKSIEKRLTAMPEAEVRGARAGSAFVVLTHDHALDFLITREVLGRKDVAYAGMIGSKTKRVTFSNWMRREAGGEVNTDQLVCPMGSATLKDKRPEVIAILIASQVMEYLNGHAEKNHFLKPVSHSAS